MAECIVCKGEYTPGQPCRRCGSDNSSWERWQEERPEEQGGIEGLLAFAAPHLYLPLFLAVLTLGFGLMGLTGFWQGVRPGIQFLAVLTATLGSFIVFQDVYTHRHTICLQRLLNQVREGWKAALQSPELWVVILPALALLLPCLLAIVLAASDLLWSLTCWLFFEPGYGTPEVEGVRERMLEASPLLLLLFYVGFTLSSAYTSSLLLALRYAGEMEHHLPQPIFLRGSLLAEVIRREVEHQLARPGGFTVRTARKQELWMNEARREGPEFLDGGSPGAFHFPLIPGPSGDSVAPAIPAGLQGLGRWRETVEHFGCWNWEEVERTPNGGITLKARGEYRVEVEEDEVGLPRSRSTTVVYTVRADPWGRIRKIGRSMEEPPGA